jgi:hypothetical protein
MLGAMSNEASAKVADHGYFLWSEDVPVDSAAGGQHICWQLEPSLADKGTFEANAPMQLGVVGPNVVTANSGNVSSDGEALMQNGLGAGGLEVLGADSDIGHSDGATNQVFVSVNNVGEIPAFSNV